MNAQNFSTLFCISVCVCEREREREDDDEIISLLFSKKLHNKVEYDFRIINIE